MLDQLTTLIVNESKWLTASMSLAMLAVVILFHRTSSLPIRRRVLAAMNLFFGVMIGTMAFGHLLAVTTKLAPGTLRGSLLVFYAIGITLAVPSWWLIYHTRVLFASDGQHAKKTLILNAWLVVTLLALGLHNRPLAAPFFLYRISIALSPLHFWAIVGLAVAANVGLFIGSLIFLASGQSFEQFGGIE